MQVYEPIKALESIRARANITLKETGELGLASDDFAKSLDAQDELSSFRNMFHFPRANPESSEGPSAVYLCGNSLGLQPVNTERYLLQELHKWKNAGVEGHFLGERPWATIDEPAAKLMAKVVGAADPDEIAIMNTLSSNLHFLLTPFFRPTATRHKILIEEGAFCSDYHVVRSQLELHGLEHTGPNSSLIELKPRNSETYIRTEDIVACIEEHGESIATVLVGGVQFYSGQAFDIKAITEAAHAKGCRVGFDLAHAAGNLELKLHEWNVDFAAWCTYKYLNSGPGCVGAIFVHNRLNEELKDLPKLSGWWGQELQDRFAMKPYWNPKPGARCFPVSNPPVVAVVSMIAALEVHDMASMKRLRAKSEQLTAYLEALLALELGVKAEASDEKETTQKYVIRQLTPRETSSRGCQLSLLFNCDVDNINKELLKEGVICDVRRPNVLRVSPAPIYNSFSDVRKFVTILGNVLKRL